MATELFASAAGNGANSADFTLTDSTLISLKGAKKALGAGMLIQLKLSDATYSTVAKLNGQNPSGIMPAATYRAVREGDAVLGLEKA